MRWGGWGTAWMTEARPSCSQIKVAMETGSSSKGKSPGIQKNKPHHEGGVPDATGHGGRQDAARPRGCPVPTGCGRRRPGQRPAPLKGAEPERTSAVTHLLALRTSARPAVHRGQRGLTGGHSRVRAEARLALCRGARGVHRSLLSPRRSPHSDSAPP